MTQVQCRSYSTLEFDGCPACADAALAATGQAAIYVLGRSALGIPSRANGPLEMAYVLYVRLIDDDGVTIATDEICAEQTIDAVPVDEDPDWMSEGSYADADGTDDIVAVDQGSMRLDDFQTVMDRLELAPMGSHGLCGRIGGRLYGFERSIGRFEIEVSPAR